jgi:O-antigen ligase
LTEVSNASRARIALTLTGLSWLLPFLSPNFHEPIPTFYGEAAAIVLGLAAITFLYGHSSWPVMRLPRASLMFLGFGALILAHMAIGRTVYPQQNLLAIVYLVWAVAMAALGWRLREIFGIERLITVLAWSALAGALLSAAIGLAQWWGIPTLLQPFTLPQVHGRIYGNTGQPNHLADYICVGMASLIFLSSYGRLRLPIAAMAAVPLIVVLVVSGSRSVWFYLGSMLVLGVFYQVLRPSRDARRVVWLSAAALGAFVLAQSLIGLAGDLALTKIESIAVRTQSEGLFPAIRFRLWTEAWLMFRDAPLLGQGFRQFPWQHFLLNAQLPPPRLQDIVYDNAHSLLFHVGAEFGCAGLLVLIAGIWAWTRGLAKREFSASTWWLLSTVAILAIHSMLEYPLWYAYFLGIAAVLLGASESAAITIGRQTGRLVPVLILLLGWTATANTYWDYRTLQSLHRMQARDADGKNTTAVSLELQQHSLFTPFVELALARSIELNQERLVDKLTVNGTAMHFAPDADVVYRQAVLLSLAGEEQAARTQWDRSVMNYPGSRAGVISVLEAMASNEPKAAYLLNYAKAHGAGD